MHPAYLLLHNPPLQINGNSLLGQWVGPHGRNHAVPRQIKPLKLTDEYDIVGVLTEYMELSALNEQNGWQLVHHILLNLLEHHQGNFVDEFVLHCKVANARSMYARAVVRTSNDSWAELSIHTSGTWEIREFYNTVLYQNGRFLNQEALLDQVRRNAQRQEALINKLFTTDDPEGFIMPVLE